MKRGSTWFLRLVMIVLGLAVLALCIFGIPAIAREVGGFLPEFKTIRYIAFTAFYASAFPFYFALLEAFKLLSYMDKNTAFSELSVHALRNIKYSTALMTFLYLLGMPLVFLIAEKDDAPGLIIIGMVLACSPFVIAVFASVLQKLFQNAVDIKSENDLIV
jgi:hypothetical protein